MIRDYTPTLTLPSYNFGDEYFAIVCSKFRSEIPPYEEMPHLVNCNIVIDNILIGDENSCEMPGLCIADLERLYKQVNSKHGNFRTDLFNGLTDDEILAQIIKSRELEDEHLSEYFHLPSLATDSLWYDHIIGLAESTDQYYIAILEEENNLKIIWQTVAERKSNPRETRSVTFTHNTFYKAVDDAVTWLRSNYPGAAANPF